ncbi:hypothetical protein [Aeromonas hydrophila]|uniref:hypothetical protein n=1 Tax=Aeromonas hydrophila TaxID=644 RepID=UPI003F7AD68B
MYVTQKQYTLFKRIQEHATLVLGERPQKFQLKDWLLGHYLSTLELKTSEQIMALVRELFPIKAAENEGE